MLPIALKRLNPLAMSPVVLAAGAVGFASTLDSEDGATFCFFRICTGGYCPGCGGSRATLALLKGDVSSSWAIHPWVPLLAVQVAIALVFVSVWGRDRARRAVVPALIFNIGLGLALWAVRLASGAVPAPF